MHLSTSKDRPWPANAYELLDQVKEQIKAEPWSYNQEMWSCARREVREKMGAHGASIYPLPSRLDVPENVCGTAFCIAGHICARVEGPEWVLDDVAPAYHAKQLLGLRYDGDFRKDADEEFERAINAIFSGGAIDYLYEHEEDFERPRMGDPGYAEAGASLISKFQARWKDRLLATPVPRPQQPQSAAEDRRDVAEQEARDDDRQSDR